MNKKRILIVDDEAPFTRLLKLGLEASGPYAVQVENNPLLAVATAKAFQPDLVLLDVMMPGMDGGELASRFQNTAALRKVPIVFLTAAVRREEVTANHGLIGGQPFLAKPVNLMDLTRCLEHYWVA